MLPKSATEPAPRAHRAGGLAAGLLAAVALAFSGTALAAKIATAQTSTAKTASICVAPETQHQMTWCAGQDYQAADLLLNQQWERSLAAMASGAQVQALRQAQRAWITFRDAHCTSEGLAYRGGSIEPMVVALCKTDLTRQRITQLRHLASPSEPESPE